MLKLMISISLVFSLSASAGNVLGQTANLKVKNQPLTEVFRILKEKIDVDFLYTQSQLQDALPVNIDVKDKSLKEILDLVFENQSLVYSLKDNTVLIKRKIGNKNKKLVNIIQDSLIIRGRVFDTHEPPSTLSNVSIAVKGTKRGVPSDVDGYFKISALQGEVLVFSMIGFKDVEHYVSRADVNLIIALEEEFGALDEVVVTGMTGQQKKHIASAVSTLNIGSQIEGKPITKLSQALQGGVTGIDVTQGSGMPGSDAARIVIRGNSNLSLPNPLVLVDGVPMSMDDLDPTTIESVTVLKDAAAAAIYGSRAANGVIVVSTKRGTPGNIAVNYNSYVGVQTPTIMEKLVDGPVYMRMYNEAYVNAGQTPLYSEDEIAKTKSGEDPLMYPNTDWQKEVLNYQAPLTSQTLSVSGGNNAARFAITGTYLYQGGMLPVNNADKLNIRANTSVSLSEKVSIMMDVVAVKSSRTTPNRIDNHGGNRMFEDIMRVTPMTLPKYPEKNSKVSYGRFSDIVNPIAYAEKGGYKKTKDDFSTINIQPKWAVLPGLNLNGQFSFRVNSNVSLTTRDPYNFFDYFTGNLLQSWAAERTQVEGRNAYYYISANGDYTLRKNDHNLFLLGGYSQEETNNGPWQIIRIVSGFAKANYSFKNKYLFEGTLRTDGSSRFGPGHKFGFFPSIAVGWNLHEENILNRSSWISNLKLRTSYGILGNESSAGLYRYQTLVNATTGLEASVGNPDISWERVGMFNAGIDFGFLNNEIELTLDYYNKLTTDLLMSPGVSLIGGFTGNPPLNNGDVRNRGVEISMNYNKKLTEGFSFHFGPGFTYNDNKIIKLYGGGPYIGDNSIHQEGDPIRSYYGYKTDGLLQQSHFDLNGTSLIATFPGQRPGDIKFIDMNGDGELTTEDKGVLNRFVDPKFNYFGNIGFQTHKFDFEFLFQGTGERAVFYREFHARPIPTSGVPTVHLSENYWTEQNTDAEFPRLHTSSMGGGEFSDFWFRNGKYLRVKFIQLGYTFDKNLLRKLRLSNARIFVNAQNPFTWTPQKMIEPESMGTHYTYPVMKTYTFGMNIKF